MQMCNICGSTKGVTLDIMFKAHDLVPLKRSITLELRVLDIDENMRQNICRDCAVKAMEAAVKEYRNEHGFI